MAGFLTRVAAAEMVGELETLGLVFYTILNRQRQAAEADENEIRSWQTLRLTMRSALGFLN